MAAITFHPHSSSFSPIPLRQKLRHSHVKSQSNSIIVCLSEQATTATAIGHTSIKTQNLDPKPVTLITGGAGVAKLSSNPLWNCAGITGIEVMKMLKIRSVGLSLDLNKGLPLGSGLGSSAASAAAAAVAVNGIFGSPLPKEDLVLAYLESEAKVSGYHADNVGLAIMGGFVLI